MLEVRVVLEQALDNLVALLVGDQVGQVAHERLDEVVDHVDGQVLHADVQHSASLHVPGELQRVLVDHRQHAGLVRIDVLRVGAVAEVGVFELLEFRLEALFDEFLDDDGGVTVAHELLDHLGELLLGLGVEVHFGEVELDLGLAGQDEVVGDHLSQLVVEAIEHLLDNL